MRRRSRAPYAADRIADMLLRSRDLRPALEVAGALLLRVLNEEGRRAGERGDELPVWWLGGGPR